MKIVKNTWLNIQDQAVRLYKKKEQLTVPSIERNSGFGGILLQLIISTCSKCVCTY
jgi:hypothetical protein